MPSRQLAQRPVRVASMSGSRASLQQERGGRVQEDRLQPTARPLRSPTCVPPSFLTVFSALPRLLCSLPNSVCGFPRPVFPLSSAPSSQPPSPRPPSPRPPRVCPAPPPRSSPPGSAGALCEGLAVGWAATSLPPPRSCAQWAWPWASVRAPSESRPGAGFGAGCREQTPILAPVFLGPCCSERASATARTWPCPPGLAWGSGVASSSSRWHVSLAQPNQSGLTWDMSRSRQKRLDEMEWTCRRGRGPGPVCAAASAAPCRRYLPRQ